MPIRNPKPTSPGRRFVTYPDFAEVTRTEPEQSLTEGQKQSGGPNAHLGQRPGAGSNNRPSIRRQGRQQRKSSGQGNDSAWVLDFLTFDLAVLGFVVGIGEKLSDRLDAGAPVGLSHIAIITDKPDVGRDAIDNHGKGE